MSRRDPKHDTTRQVFEKLLDRISALYKNRPVQLSPELIAWGRRPKPAPDVFLFAASQMGFDPHETLVVEDSLAGVTAAKRAGMKVVGFSGGGHAYELLNARLMDAGADRVCFSMVEVVDSLAPQGSGKANS